MKLEEPLARQNIPKRVDPSIPSSKPTPTPEQRQRRNERIFRGLRAKGLLGDDTRQRLFRLARGPERRCAAEDYDAFEVALLRLAEQNKCRTGFSPRTFSKPESGGDR